MSESPFHGWTELSGAPVVHAVPLEERFQLWVEGVRDCAFFLLDLQGCIQTWNGAAQDLLGLTSEEALGRPWALLFPDDDQAKALLATATEKAHAQREGLPLSGTGRQLPARVELRALSDAAGQSVGFACLIREQRVPIDAAAQRERLELLRAQEALRLRDEFLVTAAHELRTPLTAAHLQLRGLQRAVGKEPPEALRVRVERAVHGTLRLSALIEKLLDISRLEQGTLELRVERMDLAILLESVVQATAEQARRAGCTVRLDCPRPLWVIADALRMEQLLVHLLENAFRHAPGTPVELMAEAKDDQLALRLCDGGPGLPEAALGRLFQRFETFEGPGTKGSSGLGLGLFLSRQIAEAHQGTLTVENRPEGGLALTAHLPVLA